MKLAVILLFSLVSSLAMAMPSLGDYLEAQCVTTSANGTVVNSTMAYSFKSYDAAQKQFLLVTTTTDEGKAPQVVENWIPSNSMPTENQIKDILANCGDSGGTPAKVTVPAGTFDACSGPDEDSDRGVIWVAMVPFGGLVKTDYYMGGDHTICEASQVRIAP